MKKILFGLMLLFVSTIFTVGCIEEVLPTSYVTETQTGSSTTALEAFANGTAAFMYSTGYFGTLTSQEFGYPAMMIMRDALTDCPYVSTSYNHFNSYWGSLVDFTSSRMAQPWRYYYLMALNANTTITSLLSTADDEESLSPEIKQYYGNALVYRALAFMDLMRLYEYKKTGMDVLDSKAEKDGIYGLTTCIVDEDYDINNADKTPRAPFYEMYRFIMNDLNKAEGLLKDYARNNKTKADQSVVYAYKARLWLEIATRFQKYPEDLQTQLAHEADEALAKYDKLGISTAKDCYQKAAENARKVIDKYTPLTEKEWHSTTNGFNDSGVASWVFAICITSPDAVPGRVDNFLSNCVTEYSRGYSRSQYHCYRMIDKNLYDKIDDADWRKVTWVAPEDAGKNPTPDKYHTLLDDEEWAKRDAYVGFKFRPNDGDISDNYTNALQVDYPVVRVEEMYFIEAEAKAYTTGLSAGMDALSSFLNTYRYKGGEYEATPSDVEDFVDNYLIAQKRIELWGEGLAYFDIKRRELAIARGYSGTNWLSTNRYNSKQGFAPAWLNLYIPYESEGALNKAMIMNPDPAVRDTYGLWTGQ